MPRTRSFQTSTWLASKVRKKDPDSSEQVAEKTVIPKELKDQEKKQKNKNNKELKSGKVFLQSKLNKK